MYNYLHDIHNLVDEILESYDKKGTREFYQGNINKFFIEYMGLKQNANKPLNAITYFDVNTYLNGLKYSAADKLNHYRALKRFFSHTYNKGLTSDVMNQVTQPEYIKPPKQIVNEEHYELLSNFIFDRNSNIKERVTLGLFLFTGLSRQYIYQLRNKQFTYDKGVYYLRLWKEDDEITLPLKAELQILINEHLINLSDKELHNKVIERSEDYLSTYVSNLCEKACGERYTPTMLSSTFISKAIAYGNDIWEVSKLTLEKVSTIEDYIMDSENLIHKQTAILNSF